MDITKVMINAAGFIAHCPTPIIFMNMESNIRFANRAAKRVLGEDCVGRCLDEFIPDGVDHPHSSTMAFSREGRAAPDRVLPAILPGGRKVQMRVFGRSAWQHGDEYRMGGMFEIEAEE